MQRTELLDAQHRVAEARRTCEPVHVLVRSLVAHERREWARRERSKTEDRRGERREREALEWAYARRSRPVQIQNAGTRMTEASPPLTRMRPSYAATVAKKRTMRSSPPTTASHPRFRGHEALPATISSPRVNAQSPASPKVARPRGSVGERSFVAMPCSTAIAAKVPCAAERRPYPTPSAVSHQRASPPIRAAADVVAIVAESPAPAMRAHARAAACVFSG